MTYQSEVLADAPYAYHRLSEISGTAVADSSGNARDSVWSVAPTRDVDLVGDTSSQSVLFAGEYFDVPFSTQDLYGVSGQFTLEAVLIPDSVTGIRHIIGGDSNAAPGRDFQFRTNGTALEFLGLSSAAGATTVSAPGVLAVGVKHHVATTYDGTTIRLYLDGAEVKNVVKASAVDANSTIFPRIGKQIGGTGSPYTGLGDEYAFYSAALSPARIAAHAAAITTTPTTGTVAATAPAPTVAIVGTVVGPTAGLVTATAPEPTVLVSGDVPAAVTGTVQATPAAPSVHVSDAPASLPIVAEAGSETTIGPVETPTLALTSITAEAGSETTIGGVLVVDVIDTALVALAGSITRITMPRQWGEDPRTGRPTYRVRVVTRDGQSIEAFDQIVIGAPTVGVNTVDSWRFQIARADAKAKRVASIAHDAQLWRGNVMITRGPIGPGRPEGDWITYDVKGPDSLLRDGRVIGRIPKLQLLKNPGFTQGPTGLAYWSGAWDTGSALAAPPTASVVDEPEAASGKALVMGAPDKVVTTKVDVETTAVFVPNQATYLSGGEQKIRDVGTGIPNGAVVRITGFTANDGTGSGLALSLARAQAARGTLAAMGKGFAFKLPDPLRTPNLHDATVAGRGNYEQLSGGLRVNRRVTIAYEGTQTAVGHRQYERQFVTVTQPIAEKVPLTVVFAGDMKIIQWLGAPKDGWAMRLILHPAGDLSDGAIIEDSTAAMDELTPRVRWAHYSTSVDVPADGNPYVLEGRLYPPAGSSTWKDSGLWPEEQLGLFGVDQALHVKALVEHAQDTAMGHGDLGIGTRTPATGIPRTKEYRFSERMPVGTALEWFTAISHGLDIDCETTPTATTIVTHYPQQGSASGVTLRHGGSQSMIASYKPLWSSARDLASSVIMQADGSGASRPEAYARDAVALGGTLLEAVVSAEDETPLGELQEGADTVRAQSIRPRPGWQITYDPSLTTKLLDELHKGDTARLVLPLEGIDGLHRVMLRSIDPATDTITDTLLEV